MLVELKDVLDLLVEFQDKERGLPLEDRISEGSPAALAMAIAKIRYRFAETAPEVMPKVCDADDRCPDCFFECRQCRCGL